MRERWQHICANANDSIVNDLRVHSLPLTFSSGSGGSTKDDSGICDAACKLSSKGDDDTMEATTTDTTASSARDDLDSTNNNALRVGMARNQREGYRSTGPFARTASYRSFIP